MMKKVVIAALLFLSLNVCAQQDIQFTQFTQTKLNYNPAVAGVKDNFTGVIRHRNQFQARHKDNH